MPLDETTPTMTGRPSTSPVPGAGDVPVDGPGAVVGADVRITGPVPAAAGPHRAGHHLPGLDGLRGIAVVLVVAYHLGWLRGGFLGVDLFFVLSGYLVTAGVLRSLEQTGRVGLRSFWLRRVRRLAPLALVVVPTVLVVALVADWPRDALDDAATDGFATLTWWANWRQASGPGYWSDTPSLFRHAWSLSIEEQFYAAWPVVVLGAVALAGRRRWSVPATVGRVAAVLAGLSAVWLLVLSHRVDELSRVYVGTDTRMLAPLAGCALAAWWPAGRRPDRTGRVLVPLAALAGAVAFGLLVPVARVSDPDLYRRGGFLVVAVASGALVVAASRPGTRLLDVRPLRWMGVRAYGLYLWSWPVQVLVEHRWPTAGRPAVTAATLAVSVPLAALSHRLIEEPLRRPAGWAGDALPRRLAWAGVLGAAVVGVLAADGLAQPAPVHEQVSTEESIEAGRTPPPATTADGLRVMLVGDSVGFTVAYHAGNEPVDGIGRVDGRAVIGCGELAAAGWEYPAGDGSFREPAAGSCRVQTEVEQVGLSGRPDVVLQMPGAWEFQAARSPDGEVVPARSPEMADLLVASMLDRARAAEEAGARTAIVEWACPGDEAMPERRDDDYIRWINGVIHRAAEEGAASGLDVTVVEVTEEVCVGGDPTAAPTDGRRTATRDEVHVVDREGARWLWTRWLGPALVETGTGG